MDRNECIHTRVSRAEKRRITDAASAAGRTIADYIRESALEHVDVEHQADRLLTAVITALGDHADQWRREFAAMTEQQNTAATKADLRKLTEWLAARLPTN